MMSLSQETFDAVVRENIELFDLKYDAAVQDAIKQFSLQGLSLSLIITDKREDGSHPLLDKIEKLVAERANSGKPENAQQLLGILKDLENEISKGANYQLFAAKAGLYDLLISVMTSQVDNIVMIQCIKTLSALCKGYPDLLTGPSAKSLHGVVSNTLECQDMAHNFLILFKHLCKMHEGNRKMLMVDIQIADLIVEMITRHSSKLEVVIESCELIRNILSDDDIREEFNQVQLYAKLLVEEHKIISVATSLLKEHSSSAETAASLLSTLSNLAIRNEFCQEIADHGGLSLVFETLAVHATDRSCAKWGLALIKALAGNDDIKHLIGKMDGIPPVVLAIMHHLSIPAVCETGCLALAALALRHPQNAQRICDASGHTILVDALKIHETKPRVIKAAAKAIRDVVSRDRSLAHHFLDLSVEELLNAALKKYPKQCESEVKAALRDLGCDIHLKEYWHGGINPVKLD
ncbi:armadillo repeat-containing protein 6-like [Artemia franciscana]